MPDYIQQLDLLGTVFSLAATYYFIRLNQAAWPMSVIATSINSALYALSGLYGDMSLEALYFLSSFYGWYQWNKQANDDQESSIQHITTWQTLYLSALALVAISLLTLLLKHYLHSQVAILDASTTILSLIAQWMLCKKFIENWLLWIWVDSSYILLYMGKGLSFHSLLMIVYTSMAVIAYFRWHRRLYPKHIQNVGLHCD